MLGNEATDAGGKFIIDCGLIPANPINWLFVSVLECLLTSTDTCVGVNIAISDDVIACTCAVDRAFNSAVVNADT